MMMYLRHCMRNVDARRGSKGADSDFTLSLVLTMTHSSRSGSSSSSGTSAVCVLTGNHGSLFSW